MTPRRPALTLSEAATACDIDRRTIRRHLDAGKFPNAHRSKGKAGPETGPWLVPVPDLIAAGLHPNAAHTPAPPVPASSAGSTSDVDELTGLRAEVAEWRRRAEVAEAQAAEREKRAETAETALRMLTAGDPPARRRWWRRP